VGARPSAIDTVDRKLIGEAVTYTPDRSLRARTDELAASVQARRAVAWDIVKRVLTPVSHALPQIPDDDGGVPSPDDAIATLPRFQTWYSVTDFQAIVKRVLGRMPAADRAAGVSVDPAALDAVFPWLADENPLTSAEWSAARFRARRQELETSEGAASVASHETRTLLSPAAVRHLVEGYAQADACWKAPGGTVTQTPGPDGALPLHAPCIAGGELPDDAVLVKMTWLDETSPWHSFDTSATGLAARLDAGEWGDGDPSDAPGPDRIYTMHRLVDPTDPNSLGQRMRLAALHIATKELEDWVWITLWWSPTPDTDFGADRPASIGELPAVWSNYKMCTVVDYDEKDPDPTGGYGMEGKLGTLGAALAATRVHPAATTRSWCSNGYVETEERNQPTNCIGCHQHGGIRKPGPTTIRKDEAHFPDNTRKHVRGDFPYDYVWSMSSTLELAGILSDATRAP
jgi:hypothetical protein